MIRLIPVSPLLALCLIASHSPALAAAPRVEPWTYARAGLDHYYNLEYDEAIADFKKAIELEPDNAFFYNYLASAYLFKQLYNAEFLDAGLFSASNEFLQTKKIEPDPALMRPMLDALRKAREISERRLRRNPNDVEANYTMGAARGIEANYEFTINKKYLAALSDGSAARRYNDRVIELDPNYHDANLVRGVYEYILGSIPGWIKWLAFLGGYSGDKEEGIRLLQDAMSHGRYATTDAGVLLAVIYYREKKYTYVRQILTRLNEFYPRNPLMPLQIALTYIREGNHQKAIEIYEQVAKDAETLHRFGSLRRDKVFYQLGTMLQRTGETSRALVYFDKIVRLDSSDGLVKAYALLQEGEIYLGQDRPDRAREKYQAVVQMPFAEPRKLAQARLRAMKAQ